MVNKEKILDLNIEELTEEIASFVVDFTHASDAIRGNQLFTSEGELSTEAESSFSVSLGKVAYTLPVIGALTDRYLDMMPRRGIYKVIKKNNYITLSKIHVAKPVGLDVFMRDYIAELQKTSEILSGLPEMLESVKVKLSVLRKLISADDLNIELPDVSDMEKSLKSNSDNIAKMFKDDQVEMGKYSSLYRSNNEVIECMDEVTKLHSALHHDTSVVKVNSTVETIYLLAREIIDATGAKSKTAKSLISELGKYAELIKAYGIHGYRISGVIGALSKITDMNVK